jgi:hypothetical protein
MRETTAHKTLDKLAPPYIALETINRPDTDSAANIS